MAAPTLSTLFHIGVDIMKSFRDEKTKNVLLKTGSVTKNWQDSSNGEAELWQQAGFCSMPGNPVAGKTACQGVAIKTGNYDAIIATRDSRTQQMAGSLKPGETCLYAAGGDGTAQGRILIKEDGSINIFTRTDANATGMVVSVTPSSDTIALINAAGIGIMIGPDGISLTAKESGLTLNLDGSIKLIGTGSTQIDGGSITLGSSPTMAPVVNAALKGPSGVAGTASLKVSIE